MGSRNSRLLRWTLAFVWIAVVSCSGTEDSGNPDWVDAKIARFRNEPVSNPPRSIWRYEYQGRTVYYVPPVCCDQDAQLFEADGSLLCAPDGGFGGDGDGKCPDFASLRRNESLVWMDPRE